MLDVAISLLLRPDRAVVDAWASESSVSRGVSFASDRVRLFEGVGFVNRVCWAVYPFRFDPFAVGC